MTWTELLATLTPRQPAPSVTEQKRVNMATITNGVICPDCGQRCAAQATVTKWLEPAEWDFYGQPGDQMSGEPLCTFLGRNEQRQAGQNSVVSGTPQLEMDRMRHDDELQEQASRDWVDHADSPYERYLELKLKKREDALREIHRFLSQPGRVNAATKKVCISLAGFALNGKTRAESDKVQE